MALFISGVSLNFLIHLTRVPLDYGHSNRCWRRRFTQINPRHRSLQGSYVTRPQRTTITAITIQLTMQQAVLHHFPTVETTYRFTHRDANVYFNRACYEMFVVAISRAHTFSLYPIPTLKRSCARVLHPVPDLRRACLASKHLSLFQTHLRRLPFFLSLQTIPGPGVLCATWTR